MNALFSPDSKFMTAMSRVADLVSLNILFLITCLPLFTIGAASTALYTVLFRFGTDRERGLFKSYFRAFRDNFRQGTVLWLILALFLAASCVNTLLFYNLDGIVQYFFIPCAALAVLAVFLASYVFPLLSQFSNDTRSTLKNALILSLGYLPRSLAIAAVNLLPWGLLFCNLYVFLQTGFLWVFLYFSAAGYLNTLLLKKVFAPYLTGEEEA